MKYLIAIVFLMSTMQVLAQKKVEPVKPIDELTNLKIKVANDAIEAAYKDIIIATQQIDQQKNAILSPLNQTLSDAIATSQKLQGLSSEYTYDMSQHKFIKQVSPDGSAVVAPKDKPAVVQPVKPEQTKPENMPESKKP